MYETALELKVECAKLRRCCGKPHTLYYTRDAAAVVTTIIATNIATSLTAPTTTTTATTITSTRSMPAAEIYVVTAETAAATIVSTPTNAVMDTAPTVYLLRSSRQRCGGRPPHDRLDSHSCNTSRS